MKMAAKIVIFLCTILVPTVSFAQFGPISKWENKEMDEVDARIESSAFIYDIERCLMDLESMPGVPNVYSQPDRPESRQLIWSNGDSNVTARVDLEKTKMGTKIVSWRARKKNGEGFDICVSNPLSRSEKKN